MALNRVQRATAEPFSIPAPIGGWNARDALADMDEKDAVILNNWFPTPSEVQLRQGYTNFATGLPGQVNTVMAYNGASTQKIFAASVTGIYDCTAGGAVGTSVATVTSDKLVFTNFATAGGNFLYCVNGADKPWLYNGTTWTAIDGASTPAITGVTTTLLSFVYPAKSRLWFGEKSSLRVWYLPVVSVGGAATSLDFSSLCKRGGTIVAMTEWTVTGGFGMADYVAFVTSEGEMLIYQGTDPSSASTWALAGIWQFGSPMGNKCFVKYGADALYISKDGLTNMTQGRFFADVAQGKSTLTDKIQWAISQATSTYATNYGWQILPFPLQNMLILNIPSGLGYQQQYVMNSVTGAWCNFTGWPANCWELYKDQIYYGGNTVVCLAWNTYADNGIQIVGDCMQAPNYFKSRGNLKRWTMMRPILSASGIPSIYANINVDYDTTPPTNLLNYSNVTASVWDSGLWDAAIWGADSSIYKTWQGVNGVGYCASTRFKAAGNGISVNWIATDFVLERGAIL